MERSSLAERDAGGVNSILSSGRRESQRVRSSVVVLSEEIYWIGIQPSWGSSLAERAEESRSREKKKKQRSEVTEDLRDISWGKVYF